MKLRDQLLKEHTKANCTAIEKWVGKSQPRFDELFNLFLNDEYRVVQRAAWPISYIVIAHPDLIQKNFSRLLKNLQKPGLPVAVKRNTMRLLQAISIPARFQGLVMNICFKYIESPLESIAVKAFALMVLQNLSKLYPEIKPELKTIIMNRWDHESKAFQSRASKILRVNLI